MLRELAEGLWVAEAPLRYSGVQMGRRMTVVRLAGGGLWIHSPVPLNDDLLRELTALGPARFVMPASDLHGHLFMEQYRDGFPDTRLFAAPGLADKRRELTFDGELGPTPDPGWPRIWTRRRWTATDSTSSSSFIDRAARSSRAT